MSEKLKVKRVVQTCSACPSQWDIETEYGRDIYVRFRWGHFSAVLYPFTDREELLFETDYGDDKLGGVMSTGTMKQLLDPYLDFSDATYGMGEDAFDTSGL